MVADGRFDGQVAVVTGSTRGIGAGIARRLGSEGATVVVSGRTEDDGMAVVDGIRDAGGEAAFVRTDVRDPDDIDSLIRGTVAEYGTLDVLVNNAAVQTETSAGELSIEQWSRILDIDFRAYWLAARSSVEAATPTSIVNVSSNHAYHTMPAHFPYNAVKAGIDGMTRAMALDFGPATRVNTVNPGWVAVERTTADMTSDGRANLEAIHPVGRLGTPSDVAGPVAFLASDDAAYVTGASLLVDGGRGAVMQDDTLPDYRKRRVEMGE